MTKFNNTAVFTAALAGMVALSAPLAASAAQVQRGPADRAPAANERHVTPSRNAPTVSRPQQAPAARPVVRPAPTPSHRPAARLQTGTYRVTTTVNVRERASTQSRRVGQVRAGRTVQVDRVSGNWLHIRNQGWISAQYAVRR
ncbi:SH3 domain-containing protein [uncultured Brevundimonas sp.]|uniref:SH3 domain-containing protein n=1 Tax=uncultured Brevundimonas sp. TaxID=213418 RepID=UPI00261FEBCE|nr:SH3 domain-containing protein [uncultured Brevundimonas sp.]